MAAVFSGFESHRAYVGRGGKKNEKREVQERNRTETILLRVWHGIGTDITKKLVDSVPNRLNEVIRVNEYPTRY